MLAFKINKNNFPFYILLLLVIVLYLPVFKHHYRINWILINYHHAYFILPVSLWLAWRQTKHLKLPVASTRHIESLTGLALVLSGAFLYINGWYNDNALIHTFSLIPVLSGCITFLTGFNGLKLYWFPLVYLMLLIPPPLGILDNITIPMRLMVTNYSEMFLALLGYPVERNGLVLILNKVNLYIDTPCSGFRSLITLLSLGLVYVYLSSGNIKTKIVLLLSIIPIAISGNLIRIITVCLTAYYFGGDSAATIHNISGYVIFLFLLLALIVLEQLCLQLEKNNAD